MAIKYSTPINLVLFQVCWFACVIGAAYELGWLGPLLVITTVPIQIIRLTENHRKETLFVFICGISGFFLETAMIAGNVYTPVYQDWNQICPPWMAALWFNFAMLVSVSLSWLKKRYILAALLGGLAGPVAYWGGEKLGAITLNANLGQGYLVLVIVWAFVLPCLIYAHNKLTSV